MLRPIDVIFKHPIKKFTVIYQNGQLWQLPRLEFDGKSLLYKKPYYGSREHIFVANDQTLNPADELLLSQLLTVHLPESIIGRNVNQFEHWWQYNWYEFKDEIAIKRQRQQHAREMVEKAHLALGQGKKFVDEFSNHIPPNLIHDITQMQTSDHHGKPMVSEVQMAQTSLTTPKVTPPKTKTAGDDFDKMLDELTNL